MKQDFAPIVLFVYNRPYHTQKTLEALQKNSLASESELFIYSDAPKNDGAKENVEQVRRYIKTVSGFKKITIVERDTNWGLANSIIDGATKILNEYGRIIVLEDDLVTSPFFLNFMNSALETYQSRDDIFSVTGFSFSSSFMRFPKHYNHDVYLNYRPMSWSWGTWKSRWESIDWNVKDYAEFISDKTKIKTFHKGGTDLTRMLQMQMDGKLDSWYIRWSYNALLNDKLTVYPTLSYVNNIGHDNSGVHCGLDKNNIYSHKELNVSEKCRMEKNLTINSTIVRHFNKAFNIKLKSKIKLAIKKLLALS